MIKRLCDIALSLVGLTLTAPVLLFCAYRIRRYDGGPALYTPLRAGVSERPFKMYKLRSMVVNADKTGVSSTSNSDQRISPIGRTIRRFKLDELMQLLNVLKGDMSLVGPRPNVVSEVAHYTVAEKRLLTVKPGITDFSSIVFADEGSILDGSPDPDVTYNQIIRPWKSRLGLFYIAHQSFLVDIALILLTATTIISRKTALNGVVKLLHCLKAPEELIQVSSRHGPLTASAPPLE